VARLPAVSVDDAVGFVFETVAGVRKALADRVPLIGFAGAPFTLASYLIEGGGSKDYVHTRAVMRGDFAVWDELMRRLTAATVSYLNGQIDSGAQAIQLFDSWVGILTPEEFKRYALPYIQEVIRGLKPIPVIYFGTETHPFFPQLKATGANVIGVDWRTDLMDAWQQLGDVAVQGNLDPQVLLTDPDTVRKKTLELLQKVNGRPGHIFNLGHGILPNTPMENVRAMIETVKDWKN
jgi:uroporphyrinogen decarboxylase